MVARPDRHDKFHDVRTNYNYSEPTLASNYRRWKQGAAKKAHNMRLMKVFEALDSLFLGPPVRSNKVVFNKLCFIILYHVYRVCLPF